jgi:membrane dipeptidase
VDLHADLPYHIVCCRSKGEHQVLERCHLEKLRKGYVSTLIAAIWVESEYKPAGALKRGLQITDAVLEDVKESHSFQLVHNYQELLDAEKGGKIGLILGVEGGEIMEDDLGLLRNFHRLGVRSFGLVHNERNLIADGIDHTDDDMGLSEFGKRLIRELDRLGIIVDLAHTTPKSFWGVLEVSTRPLILSHTLTSMNISPYVKDKFHRTRTDDQLKAVASNGGIVGIYTVNMDGPSDIVKVPDLNTYCDHVEHAVRVAGPDHVGLGLDFVDYFPPNSLPSRPPYRFTLTSELEDHSKLNAVTSELSRRGLSDDELRMVTRDNFVRVFKAVVG